MAADNGLVGRQKLAAFSLLFQGSAFSVFGFISADIMLHFGPIELTGLLVMVAIFGSPAVIPLFLGVRLYRGKLTKWAYQGWAGVSLCLGVLFLILLPFRLPIISPYYVDFLGLLYVATTCFFLIVPWAVLRLTRL